MSTTEITADNFQSLIETSDILMLDCWAEWCGPCRAFAPVYEAASERHAGVVFGKLDTESQPELAGAFGIQSIPTVMVFRQGILLFRQAGMLPGIPLATLMFAGLAIYVVTQQSARRQTAAVPTKSVS